MSSLPPVAMLVAAVACSKSPAAFDAGAAARKGGSFEDFDTTSPRVGEAAPGFELQDLGGRGVRLADALARGPVVLVFGSFS